MGVFTTTKAYRLGLNLTNQWWLSGASIDLDFDNGRYYDSSLGAGVQSLAPLNSYLSISRASTGYAQNLAGAWIAFGNDTLRITDKGLLVEDARTNYLLNSTAPTTQTTASLSTGSYTLWVEGSGSATSSAGSATITGAGAATAGTPNTFSVTVAGTVTVTVSGSLTRFQLEAGAFASSPIDTTGASATRAQDLVTLAGAADTIVKAIPYSALFDGVGISTYPMADHALLYGKEGSNPQLFRPNTPNNQVLWNGSVNATLGNSLTWLTGVKVATGLGSGATSLVAGGGTVVTDSSTQTMSGTVRLGSQSGGSPTSFWGYIRRFTLWNSKLADATLQSLTAP